MYFLIVHTRENGICMLCMNVRAYKYVREFFKILIFFFHEECLYFRFYRKRFIIHYEQKEK